MAAQSRLAPRRGLELADEAFDFLRANTRQLLGVAAIFVIPVQLLVAYLSRATYEGNAHLGLLKGGSTGIQSSNVISLDFAAAITSIGGILSFFTLAAVAGPVALMVAAWARGGAVSTSAALRLGGKRWLSLIAACALVHVCEVIGGIAFGLGTLFAMVVFAVATPVVVLEGAGPFRAIARSWTLSLRRFGPVLGVVLAMTLTTVLFNDAIGLVPTTLPQFVGFSGGWLLAGAGQMLAKLVTVPITAAFAALLYIDLRSWTEGMDIVVALSSAGRAALP